MALALGAAHGALSAYALTNNLSEGYPQEVAFHVLVGLGLSVEEARRVALLPIDDISLPADALLERTHGE